MKKIIAQIQEYRHDFPILKNTLMEGYPLVYFDNAATTLKPQSVIKAVSDYYSYKSVNIHRGDYLLSYTVSQEYEETRALVAKLLNAKINEIVFSYGTTDSINMVAFGYFKQFLKSGDIILTTEVEHASNLLPWFYLKKEIGIEIEYVPLAEAGTFSLENYKKALHSKVKLVTLAGVSNVLGYLLPLKEIVGLAHLNGSLVVVDAAQVIPHQPFDVKALDIDFLAFSGHKMLGPSGVGVLYGKTDLLNKMQPVRYGGGSNASFQKEGEFVLKESPYCFESGTPAIEAVLGFKAAIKYLEKVGLKNIKVYEEALTSYFINKLKALPQVIIYNPESVSGIVSFNIKGIFSQDVASYLSTKGIAVRSGNHCAKILKNIIGVNDSLRASLYFYNTFTEVDYFIEVLKDVTLERVIDTVL